ncbi:MAG: hypothetical protein ACLQPV_01565 [Vulcanimicrobiaceae bacterium]
MRLTARTVIVAVALGLLIGAMTKPATAQQTSAQAMASLGYLAGTWHCTGGGPAEDDTYTMNGNWWRDTDSLGDLATGTYDAKLQKWVVLIANADGSYAALEGTSPMSNNNVLNTKVAYPASNMSPPVTFTKVSDTQYTLGKQTCTKAQ